MDVPSRGYLSSVVFLLSDTLCKVFFVECPRICPQETSTKNMFPAARPYIVPVRIDSTNSTIVSVFITYPAFQFQYNLVARCVDGFDSQMVKEFLVVKKWSPPQNVVPFCVVFFPCYFFSKKNDFVINVFLILINNLQGRGTVRARPVFLNMTDQIKSRFGRNTVK